MVITVQMRDNYTRYLIGSRGNLLALINKEPAHQERGVKVMVSW